jgi:deoxyribose-phosphate aldolase
MTTSDSNSTTRNSSENTAALIQQLKTASEALRARLDPGPRQNRPSKPNKRTATTPISLAPFIDHTLLKPDATRKEVARVCAEARTHGFATVCLNSSRILEATALLQGCSTVPIAVVGFPLGAASTASKAFEARQAVADGAREIDMVIALGPLKEGDYETVFKDILAVVQAAAPYPIKVIIEASALNLEEKIAACTLSQSAGAAFVKTSTGFGSGGATVQDIALMREVVGPSMGVKASGGIRTTEDAERMIAAGADRIGASTSVAIVTHKKATAPGPGGY